ncbi:sigma-54 interaction domain-containing protein [Desulfolithobacter sp.]
MITEYFCENWKHVIDTMTEGLMIVDTDGTILYVNKALQELLQYSQDELVGKTCEILACSSCFDESRNNGEKHCGLFTRGRVRNLRCAFKCKDGRRVQVYKNATVLRDEDGNIVAGVENLTDITPILSREAEIRALRRQLQIEDSFHGLIGVSTVMQNMYQLIESAALSDAPVLIYGESGTGKELVADALYHLSPRRDAPFVKVNCAALNESLLESELFGHVKGAFTGADRSRKGRFEAAHTGCIFLDEIGDMPLSTQTKLLRVLQEQELERVGDNRTITIDVRVIAATNRDLEEMMQNETFRQDLYYRLSVIPVHVPPLRERCDDIPVITKHLIRRLELKTGKPISGITRNAMDLLLSHPWPGNVRELINVLEYAFVLCHDEEIDVAHLPAYLYGKPRSACGASLHKSSARLIGDDEKKRIQRALSATGGNRTKAAELLGISRVTLWKRMKKFGMS